VIREVLMPVLQVPSDRFDASTHCDPSGKIKNSTLSAFGCFINQPGLFDTRLFNMSPREAAQTDPVHRLLLMVTYEALELAGYVQDGSPDSLNVGTFFGACTDDYREYNSGQDVDVYYITGGLRCFGPGRLNYYFKWEGPSFSVDTACSSSAAAIDLACQSILSGKCKTAVAGGGNIMTGSNMYAGLSRGGFLSPTGSSKTFDDGADGYCRADAVGVVVLKRLSDAIAAGDNIRGVIRGVGTNHSAYASSITQPHTPTQVKLYEKVLRDSRLSPGAVSYVEMHGTGTQAGDTMEMNSVLSTFGVKRSASNPLYVGAVKANVGHSEAVRYSDQIPIMFANHL
jgi:acyl transferase domain-containing protein